MRTVIFSSLTLALLSQRAGADTTLSLDPSTTWGTWEGWGVSLAWWAKAFGNRDDLATVFFSLNSQTIDGQTLPGLGFNIARYNAGACSNNIYDGDSMVVSSNIKPSRQMDSFGLTGAVPTPHRQVGTGTPTPTNARCFRKPKQTAQTYSSSFLMLALGGWTMGMTRQEAPF